MSTFVLVPGAWHGSWSWSEVAPLLQAAGHRVLTPDLLISGCEGAAVTDPPLAAWADQVAALLRSEPEPVILVGHSRGGLVISEVAERVPEKVELLVYLAAFLLRDGETLQEIAQRSDNAATFGAAVGIDGGMLNFSKDALRPLLYHQAPERLVHIAREQLLPEPLVVFTTPVHVTDERFGSTPRAYIECTEDQAIPLNTQRMMQAALPCAFTLSLPSDHSPFFSMAAALCEAFETCASWLRYSQRCSLIAC